MANSVILINTPVVPPLPKTTDHYTVELLRTYTTFIYISTNIHHPKVSYFPNEISVR